MDEKKQDSDPFNIKGITNPLANAAKFLSQVTDGFEDTMNKMQNLKEYNGVEIKEEDRQKINKIFSENNAREKLKELKERLANLGKPK